MSNDGPCLPPIWLTDMGTACPRSARQQAVPPLGPAGDAVPRAHLGLADGDQVLQIAAGGAARQAGHLGAVAGGQPVLRCVTEGVEDQLGRLGADPLGSRWRSPPDLRAEDPVDLLLAGLGQVV